MSARQQATQSNCELAPDSWPERIRRRVAAWLHATWPERPENFCRENGCQLGFVEFIHTREPMTGMSQKDPGADGLRVSQIITWHALGHDALDGYEVARFADGLEYTIAERIELLAGRPPARRLGPDIREAS